MQEKGSISIHTENIFPIIKKFLYSDNEIFLRELVSNAVDATQKIKRLASLGQYTDELGDLRVEVAFDADKKTITISDNGLGMTAEEIKKYINQIAFSGATEFMEKFKEAKDANEIIGRFGLGFYSAFMVADQVEIQTLSYQDGAEPARPTRRAGRTVPDGRPPPALCAASCRAPAPRRGSRTGGSPARPAQPGRSCRSS